MNTSGTKVAVRLAALSALLLGASVVACSSAEPDPQPLQPMGGSAGSGTVLPGGSSGAANMSGSGGAAAGSGAMGAACTAPAECPMGQQCIMMKCGCPGYAPTYCEADKKCASTMKDADHCGDCATKCGATAACNAGACTTEPMSIGEIAGCGTLKLQIAGGKIYALSTMTGDLASMAAPAGGAATPIATGITGATAFVVDATNAYVAAGMTLVRVALADGTKTTVVTETAPIHDVAVAGTKVFYATGLDIKSVDAAAAAGATGVQVAIAADEGEPQGVAAVGTYVLYGSNSAMNLESCDTTMACNMTMLDPGPGHVKIGASQGGLIFGHRSVQADATKVYWINNGVQGAPYAGAEHNAMGVSPKDGGKITAFAIAADGTAYFTDETENFEKGKLGDAESTWLARKVGMVSSLVLDDTSAYLASGCKILKAPL